MFFQASYLTEALKSNPYRQDLFITLLGKINKFYFIIFVGQFFSSKVLNCEILCLHIINLTEPESDACFNVYLASSVLNRKFFP